METGISQHIWNLEKWLLQSELSLKDNAYYRDITHERPKGKTLRCIESWNQRL